MVIAMRLLKGMRVVDWKLLSHLEWLYSGTCLSGHLNYAVSLGKAWNCCQYQQKLDTLVYSGHLSDEANCFGHVGIRCRQVSLYPYYFHFSLRFTVFWVDLHHICSGQNSAQHSTPRIYTGKIHSVMLCQNLLFSVYFVPFSVFNMAVCQLAHTPTCC